MNKNFERDFERTMNIFKKTIITYLLLPLILISVLFTIYLNKARSLPFHYWDEYEWVSRSYFFEFYTPKDLNHPVWDAYESYDQPKLTELLFGFWLSMRFYIEIDHTLQYPYTTFLLKNNFTSLEQDEMELLLQQSSVEPMDENKWIDGKLLRDVQSLTAARIVYQARLLNLLFLLITIVITYYLLLQLFHPLFALGSAIYYGLNSLIIESSLVAHSEALFLLTFTTALLFFVLYVKRSGNLLYIVIFMVFTGLCASTKLNGFLLLGIYCLMSLIQLYHEPKKIKPILRNIFATSIVPFMILVLLNPYTFSSPLVKTYELFQWRVQTSTYEQTAVDFLSTPAERLQRIIEHFSTTDSSRRYDNILERVPNVFENMFLLTLSLSGLIYYSFKAIKADQNGQWIIVSFLVIIAAMCLYLFYDWDRYYVQLVIFIIIFQVTSLRMIFNLLYAIFLRAVNRPSKK